MKINIISLSSLVTVLGSASLLAVTPPQTATVKASASTSVQFQTIDFGHSAEADMMHRAYRILASGDHDYHGHRVAAMHEIHKAADMLGMDLTADERGHEKQFLSNDRLREARGLLKNVLNSAEFKGQERISHHIELAIREIDGALRSR